MRKSDSQKRLLILVNEDRFFISHRLEIGRAAVASGWHVTVATAFTGREGEISAEGMEVIPLPCKATAIDALSDVRLLRFLMDLFRRERGAVFHFVGMKLIFFGNVSARLAGVNNPIVNAVCGLGIFFLNPEAKKARMLLKTLRFMQPKGRSVTIFQNSDDERIFREAGLLQCSAPVFIKGSGVDLERYSYEPIPEGSPAIVLFTGRLLRSKGVPEFAKAAEMLRSRWEGRVEFRICGELSLNSDGLTAEDMAEIADGEYVHWLGHVRDVPEQLKKACMMVFPSYYREGVPLSLLEASSIGRPIITCDSVGCRDAVEEGVNGYLVTPRDAEAIAARIEELLRHPETMSAMGKASRSIAERDYDRQKVVTRHLQIYNSLME